MSCLWWAQLHAQSWYKTPWKKIEVVELNLLYFYIQKNFPSDTQIIYWKTEGNSRGYVKGREYYDKSNSKDHCSQCQLCKFNIKMYHGKEVWCAVRNHQRLSVQPRVDRPTDQPPKGPAAMASRAWQTHQRSSRAEAEGKKSWNGSWCVWSMD